MGEGTRVGLCIMSGGGVSREREGGKGREECASVASMLRWAPGCTSYPSHKINYLTGNPDNINSNTTPSKTAAPPPPAPPALRRACWVPSVVWLEV